MKTILLDTSARTANLGDRIIVEAALAALPDLEQAVRVGTHGRPRASDISKIIGAKNAIFVGTNVLTAKLWRRRQWPSLSILNQQLRGKVIYLGVGWGSDTPVLDQLTVRLLRRTMQPNSTIGVRDVLTYERALASGLPVTYIGCPTTWSLPSDHPRWLGVTEAVITVTDYNQDVEEDTKIVNAAAKYFEKLYFWPQGRGDEEYFRSLRVNRAIEMVPRTVAAYDERLRTAAHVGTRLHGGIRALQHGRPSIIFSVDHRAASIGKDTGIDVVPRGEDPSEILQDRFSQSWRRTISTSWPERDSWIDDLKRRVS